LDKQWGNKSKCSKHHKSIKKTTL